MAIKSNIKHLIIDREHFPISEQEKTIETVQRLWTRFMDEGLSRDDVVHAIGGGVLLDTVGFACATYKRGIRWISEPTTLLAMVDAGSGGKTGVNYGGVKNAVGCFWPPIEVIIHPDHLKTLPGEEILSGYAELVKTELLKPKLSSFAPQLSSFDFRLSTFDCPNPFELTESDIRAAIAIKDHYVALDPMEKGIRKALNLGHTIGHALEALSLAHYGERVPDRAEKGLRHGYAVMYGLAAELYLSHVRLGLDKAVVSQIAHLITEYYGRPSLSCKRYDELIDLMRQDKKGALNFTLLRAIGEPVINQVLTENEIKEALDYLFSI